MKKVFSVFSLFILLSSAATAQWVNAGSGLSSYYGDCTSLAFDSAGVPHVALSSDFGAFVFTLNGTVWNKLGANTAVTTGARNISMAMYQNSPLIAYQEKFNNDDPATDIYGPSHTWQSFGASPISHGFGWNPQLAIDSTGAAHLIYIDGGINYLTYNGANWGLVSAVDSATNLNDYSFVPTQLVMKGITPYIAFTDPYHNLGATVMYFNGSIWDTLGRAGFTDSAYSVSMAKDTQGTLYLAVTFGAPNVPNFNPHRSVQVYKFDGINWNSIDSPFTGTCNTFTSLAVSKKTNHLFLYYPDYTHGNKLNVKEYNGTNWIQVGSPNFAPQALGVSLAISFDDVPYISFIASDSLQVLRFEGSVGIKNVNENRLSVYPNPANHMLYINSPAIISLVQVSDISGRIVLERSNLNTAQIDICSLVNGFYHLKLVSETSSYNLNFVKE